jgi:hypothetical protein
MSCSVRQVKLGFDWRDDLAVEWAGHPNWYFRISKFSIPYLRHESVPRTWFLDRLERIPDDLQNYALKPLYSFAGLGVVIAPKKKISTRFRRRSAGNTFCRSGCTLSR